MDRAGRALIAAEFSRDWHVASCGACREQPVDQCERLVSGGMSPMDVWASCAGNAAWGGHVPPDDFDLITAALVARQERQELRKARNEDGSQSVYFIQAFPSGRIKVGWSRDVKARLRDLQTSAPEGLHLLASSPGPRSLETLCHRLLGKHHVHGEWFNPCDVLTMMIKAAKRGELGAHVGDILAARQ